MREVSAMQDNTRTDIQCSEAVHGNESEVVRQLYTALQGRGSKVSLRFILELFEVLSCLDVCLNLLLMIPFVSVYQPFLSCEM